jgi:hypothetical protein
LISENLRFREARAFPRNGKDVCMRVCASDKLLRLFQELSAAPSCEDARQVFEGIDAAQLSESEYEVVCAYYANILHEYSR